MIGLSLFVVVLILFSFRYDVAMIRGTRVIFLTPNHWHQYTYLAVFIWIRHFRNGKLIANSLISMSSTIEWECIKNRMRLFATRFYRWNWNEVLYRSVQYNHCNAIYLFSLPYYFILFYIFFCGARCSCTHISEKRLLLVYVAPKHHQHSCRSTKSTNKQMLSFKWCIHHFG